MLLDRLKLLLQDPPPAMAFEISEAGIAAARIEARARTWRFIRSSAGLFGFAAEGERRRSGRFRPRRCGHWRRRVLERRSGRTWR